MFRKELEVVNATTLSARQTLTQEPQSEEDSYREAQCRCRPRIMVVDDNNFNIVPVKMMLEN